MPHTYGRLACMFIVYRRTKVFLRKLACIIKNTEELQQRYLCLRQQNYLVRLWYIFHLYSLPCKIINLHTWRVMKLSLVLIITRRVETGAFLSSYNQDEGVKKFIQLYFFFFIPLKYGHTLAFYKHSRICGCNMTCFNISPTFLVRQVCDW